MTAQELESLAQELDQLTVIERAYAMQALLCFQNAAYYKRCSTGDFINKLNLADAALALAGLKRLTDEQ